MILTGLTERPTDLVIWTEPYVLTLVCLIETDKIVTRLRDRWTSDANESGVCDMTETD